MRINDIHLTKFSIPFAHSASTRVVRKAWIAGEVEKKWKESIWCKRVQDAVKVLFRLLSFLWHCNVVKLIVECMMYLRVFFRGRK